MAINIAYVTQEYVVFLGVTSITGVISDWPRQKVASKVYIFWLGDLQSS